MRIILSKGEVEREYKVVSVKIKDILLLHQLKIMGIVAGCKIRLLKYNYNKKSILIKVLKINYAIDKKICDLIEVEYE